MRAFLSTLPTVHAACTLVLICSLPGLAAAEPLSLEERLERLESRQLEFEREIRSRDERIQELEQQLEAVQQESPPVIAQEDQTVDAAPADADKKDESSYGEYTPERGVQLAVGDWGSLNFSAYSYVRYLNQRGLDDTYTDSQGNTRELDLRNDFQLSKVNLYMKGWLLDPKFNYVFYTWTNNNNQGGRSAGCNWRVYAIRLRSSPYAWGRNCGKPLTALKLWRISLLPQRRSARNG